MTTMQPISKFPTHLPTLQLAAVSVRFRMPMAGAWCLLAECTCKCTSHMLAPRTSNHAAAAAAAAAGGGGYLAIDFRRALALAFVSQGFAAGTGLGFDVGVDFGGGAAGADKLATACLPPASVILAVGSSISPWWRCWGCSLSPSVRVRAPALPTNGTPSRW